MYVNIPIYTITLCTSVRINMYTCFLFGYCQYILIAPMIELASQTDYRNNELKAELDRRKKVYP